jgi:predicted CopG family antitoxin
MPKSVKVHDDTHRVLKLMKSQRRSKSIDEVIRDLIKSSTGRTVSNLWRSKDNSQLTSFFGK